MQVTVTGGDELEELQAAARGVAAWRAHAAPLEAQLRARLAGEGGS